MSNLRPAVFLDRDGVIIEDSHFVASAQEVRMIPGAADAIAALNAAGWVVVVVTNQSGVARGFFGEDTVEAVHAHIVEKLAERGARVDAFHYCPHHPDGEVEVFRADCDCRKPKPGMLRRAAEALGIDLSKSWMVGDRPTDLQAGAAVGCRTVLVRTGYGAKVDVNALDRAKVNLVAVVADLREAIDRMR
ncbi:MAG TPA: D-glycero-beta-D-manno-heptose 1,7-bisphosphate 7-phosphatase [Gemmataceae bacterium]|nr:D-glycero-beta-D-manno-heptose 1,7-bisphosphate 7-phosphatase [Gemmataceae bacterium]